MVAANLTLAQTRPVEAAVLEAVYGFYSGYMDYTLAGPADERTGSYVADRAYRDSPFLTTRLVRAVDSLVENADPAEGWGDDPFLLARGVPARIGITVLATARHNATALVDTYYGVNPLPQRLAVRLVDEAGLWKLDDIRRDDLTPAGFVQRFYEAALPPTRRSAHPPACANVAEAEDETDAPLALRVDPFPLGALQPRSVGVAVVKATRWQAEVLVVQQFDDQPERALLVALAARDGCWRVSRIGLRVEPQVFAQVLYNRYLEALRYDLTHGLPLANLPDAIPLADFMTSEALEAALPSLLAVPAPETDPLLQTAKLPQAVHAELIEANGDTATVLVEGIYADGQGSSHREALGMLDMMRDGDRWRIENISPQ